MYHLPPVHALRREDRRTGPLLSGQAVAFDGVSFAYDAGPEVLKDISFSIEVGQTVALVGHAGAGKSSCARLLSRLWDVTAGAVRVAGMDVRDLPPSALHDLVALVPQDCDLRPETLADNLRRARANATAAEIEAAAKAAQVHDVIRRLPRGYDTPCTVWSERLTAAERQRIALARAVLAKASVLVLDETRTPMSAADEAAWASAIANLSPGRTVLLISNRLPTIRLADWIVVIEQGVVVEEGRHEHLMAWNDRYTQLIATQVLRQ